MKKTLVLGASTNPNRYSHMAIKRLRAAGHQVIAIGRSKGDVADVSISELFPIVAEDIHTITVYLRANLQPRFYNQILGSKAKRIIFNPGTEDPALMQKFADAKIDVLEACTLVLLRTNQY